mgnify:CR=1 FL=1
MNGIEKITGRIEADAQEQAKAIAAEAEARCAEIRADYDKQAQDQYWARVRDGVKACEDRVQRMGRLAEMEARKSVLARQAGDGRRGVCRRASGGCRRGV